MWDGREVTVKCEWERLLFVCSVLFEFFHNEYTLTLTINNFKIKAKFDGCKGSKLI